MIDGVVYLASRNRDLPDFFSLSTSLAALRHPLPALCRLPDTSRGRAARHGIHMNKTIDKTKKKHRIGKAAPAPLSPLPAPICKPVSGGLSRAELREIVAEILG